MPRVTDIARRSAIALLLTLATTFASAGPPAASSTPDGPSSVREAQARSKLEAVRAEIARIAAAQRETAERRQSIDAQLARQARVLDEAATAVRNTDSAISAQSDALADLQDQRGELETKLSGQRAALADLLRAAYTLNVGSNLSLLLGDGDVARIQRALAYSRYFQRDRLGRIHALLADFASLGKLETSIRTKTLALQQQRAQRTARVRDLENARDAQEALLARADAELAEQKGKLADLKRDAQALDRLLKKLQDVFSDIPAGAGKHPPFAKLRGKLPPPVAGRTRRGSGATAHGIVIAARPGAEVHAVAYGRVAWADFMRGYGMLVIIDHGDGWMSLYGGNESLEVSVGEWVGPGQPIATAGKNSETGGAWFGLRHDGKPVDPDGWMAK